MAVQPAGGDYRSGGGIGVGAPLGTKASRYLPEDDAGPQRPFAVVVGGGDIATGDKKKKVTAAFADALGELSSSLGSRGRSEQPVEPTIEIGAVLGESGVLEIGTAVADADSAQQELVEARCEAGVATVHRVLRIAQQMGQAQLAFLAMPGLGRVTVGHPDLGLGVAEEIIEHRGAAAVGNQVMDGGRRQ